MKKFYCNGKVLGMHNDHNSLSAKVILKELGIASEFGNVFQAPDQLQDMLGVCDPDFEEAIELEVPDYKFCEQEAELGKFFVDMLGDEDYDHYVLPNGKSAPYGLTGVEVAALPPEAMLYSLSLYKVEGITEVKKAQYKSDQLLIAVDRDLVFATREKAVEAYNALFGDLYGTV